MIYEKAKYERLIAESPLFSLDKEEQYTAYKRESYKMIENLYCYLMAVNETAYEPYGCEITGVATRCINNFDTSKGIFLHYFNSAWKQEYSHILGDKVQEEKMRGIKISEDDRRAVKKYKRLLQQRENHYSPEELYRKLSEAMDMSVDRIREIEQIGSVSVISDSVSGDDGEDYSLWDQVSDGFTIDGNLMDQVGVEALLDKIEHVFSSLQERQKPIISDLLTVKVCVSSVEMVHPYSFINQDILGDWNKSGHIPTQRDIANRYNRDEASISRTYKEFLKKLKREG